MFTGALVVMVLGVGMGLGGWLSFRRPGVTMLPVPSIWRTPRFLTWPGAVLSYLGRRQDAGATEDCPLPELFRHARLSSPGLTIGHFHDGLRRLLDAGHIYLHPWTGPLYALPEPPYALLVGHEIAYYASKR